MSDSVRPHRQQPTRLFRPWDSPGKNTGVGCHFLLQCLKVESERKVAQSFATPSDPMDCSLPGSSIHGIFQARVLEWGATAFSPALTSVKTSASATTSLQHKRWGGANKQAWDSARHFTPRAHTRRRRSCGCHSGEWGRSRGDG